jgi:hypothetical protein
MASNTVGNEIDEKKAISGRDPEVGGVAGAPISGSDSVSVREDAAGDGAVQPADEPASALPFSKGRCIALVATVTGASFLNVSS